MYFLEIQILQRTQKSVSVKPFPKEAGQKSKTPAACQRPKSVLPKIPIRMEMEGPVWFQYHLLVSKKRIAHFRSDSNSKIKICGACLPKSGSEQRNPCYLPNSQVYWTLDCTFSVANDFNVDRESPMERKGTISKDDL